MIPIFSYIFFYLVPFIYFSYFVYKLFFLIKKSFYLFIRPYFFGPFDPKKYGSWSVITGSTNGIGKGIALELAKRGSNIALISRNSDLLEETAKEIREKFGVKVITIQYDFTNATNYQHIQSSLENLDIGILVNNVGMASSTFKIYHEYSDEFITNIINVNITSCCMMTKIVLPFLLKKKKGIVVNVGSLSHLHPIPLASLYPSTKEFVNTLTDVLRSDYPFKNNGVIFHCLNPGYVSTNMTNMKRKTLFCPGWGEYARSSVESFSYDGESSGYLPHFIQGLLLKILPSSIVVQQARKRLEKIKNSKTKSAKSD